MKKSFLKNGHLHLWHAWISNLLPQFESCLAILNEEEKQRALRFRFLKDRHRYTIARATLRRILSLYLNVLPEKIEFFTAEYGKPYLKNNLTDLQFNLSHSHDLVLYAITTGMQIGVDVEKIERDYQEPVAQRFFSRQEYNIFSSLAENEKNIAFYHLWAGKEAILKATGAGLHLPTSSFSLDLRKNVQRVELIYQNQTHFYYLENILIDKDYSAAIATSQKIAQIDYWEWTSDGPLGIGRPK